MSRVRAGQSRGDQLVPEPVSEPLESAACDVVVLHCLCDLGETDSLCLCEMSQRSNSALV